MKGIWTWTAMAACLAMLGCGGGDDIVRLKEVPEIDHSALDSYVEFGEASISSQGLMVTVTGTAKMDLGFSWPVKVDRFAQGNKLDTTQAFVVRNEPDTTVDQDELRKKEYVPPSGPEPPGKGWRSPQGSCNASAITPRAGP